MPDLFLGTFLGTVVRLGSSGRLLQFHEDRPGFEIDSKTFSSGSGDEESSTRNDSESFEKQRIVSWYSNDDPMNPQNWSGAKKTFVAVQICLYTFVVYCGSSIYVPSETGVMAQFNVSSAAASLGLALYVVGYGLGPLLFAPLSEIPAIGRNPVYIATFACFLILSYAITTVETFGALLALRFLQGFFGSPCLANGAASLSDVFSLSKLSYPIMAWSGSMYCGPSIGPVLSSFSVAAKDWRWSLKELAWMASPIFVLLVVFLPETSHETILYYRAKRLRRSTGILNLTSESELKQQSLTFRKVAVDALVKPFEISIKDPAVAFTHFYTSLTYGIYYSFFEAFPIVYLQVYDFSRQLLGAEFLCILVATFIGITIYSIYYAVFEENKVDQVGKHTQESFLVPGLPATFGPPIGLFLFGWASKSSIPWPVPTLGIVFYCASTFIVVQAIFMYLPLSYPRYAASLFAANDMLRSCFAAGAVLFARPLYINLGVGKGISVLGGLSVLGILGLFYLYKFGERMRKRSRFTG